MRAVFRRWLAAWVAQEPRGLREVCPVCKCSGRFHELGVHDPGAQTAEGPSCFTHGIHVYVTRGHMGDEWRECMWCGVGEAKWARHE